MYGIEDHWGYGQIIVAALQRIDSDRERGGGYAAFARTSEQVMWEHVPESQQRGDTCASCGASWPCATFASIFAPD